MSGVPEVIKGSFTFAVAGQTLTIAARGVTKVVFPHATTAGLLVVIDLTGKSWTFDFNNYTSGNNGCGITESVDWANDMPWYYYLINDDNTAASVEPCVTRNPCMTQTPAEAYFHYTDADAGTDAQTSVFVNYADGEDKSAKPVVCIGSLKMTWATADDEWTPTALTYADGFGKFQEGVKFTYPAGQNGNVANYYWRSDASADIPTYATPASIAAFYFIDRNGFVDYTMTTTGAGNCTQDPGAGAVDVLFQLPYAFSGKETTSFMTYVISRIRINNVTSLMNLGGTLTEGFTGMGASFMSESVANTTLQEDNWGDNANDDVSFRFSYSAF